MMKAILAAVLAACVAQGGMDAGGMLFECDSYIAHYYVSGCRIMGSGSSVLGETDAIANCNATVGAAGLKCQAAVRAWTDCLDGTPMPANGAQCDCSSQAQAVAACEQ